MSLTEDNIVQTNSGATTSAATSVNVSLPSGTTAGNTVVVVIGCTTGAITAPAGFVAGKSQNEVNLFYKSEVAAGEGVSGSTHWTFTTIGSVTYAWVADEWTNIDSVEPVDGSAGTSSSISNDATLSTGTSAQSAGLSTVAYGAWLSAKPSTDTHSWAGYTNSFTEIVEVDPGGVVGTHLAVARKYLDGYTGSYESTATFTTSGAAASVDALVCVLRAADTSIVAPLHLIAGYEWGTHAGYATNGVINLHGALFGPTSVWGTAYQVSAGSARNSNYGLRITNSATSGNVGHGSMTTAKAICFGFNVRVVSATGTVVVAYAASATALQIVYDATNSKFGLRWGTGGTPSWQSGTTATNTWVWIDVRLKTSTSTFHADWRIETATDTYTDQTSPADASGTANVISTVVMGATVSQTMTVDYDDVVMAPYYVAYPLGPHQVRLLVPETTGATVSGTSTNFSKFTANGTLAAWASDAGALIDEVPPTISASSDGVVQTAVAASDYMQFPMTTYTCAYNEVIAAVRMLCSEWGGTGSGTGTLGFRGYDGTTETTFIAASASYDADSLTTASSTYPLWKCAMWPSVNGWTQTELNAAALRVGFSTDATPDMGVSAAYLEIAVKKVPPVRTLTVGEADEFYVDLVVHPYTSATVSYVITNDDATRDVTFDYSISGTPQTPVVVTPGNNSTLQLNADAFGDISDVTLTPEVL